ncbi:MAG: hypothetical protein R3C56_04465 [Pirellulaceae bacterium]
MKSKRGLQLRRVALRIVACKLVIENSAVIHLKEAQQTAINSIFKDKFFQ